MPLAEIPLRMIKLGENVRKHPEAKIAGMATSIKNVGVLQPILLCPDPDDPEMFELLCGQRRYLGAQRARLAKIPAMVRNRPTKLERLDLQMEENYERLDMSPVDEALAFQAMNKLGRSQKAIATKAGKGAGYVTKRLKLLQLPVMIQAAVDLMWISPDCALSLPPQLFVDEAAMRRLKRKLESGDDAVRAWAYAEFDAYKEGVASRGGYRGPSIKQQFNGKIDSRLIKRCKTAARLQGIQVALWIENALRAACDEQLGEE